MMFVQIIRGWWEEKTAAARGLTVQAESDLTKYSMTQDDVALPQSSSPEENSKEKKMVLKEFDRALRFPPSLCI